MTQVKSLEWIEAAHGIWTAQSAVGEYSVGFDDGWWAQLEGPEPWEWESPENPRFYCGPSAGMCAAQADYGARVLAAIEPDPHAAACVRACAGIPTDQLAAAPVGALAKVVEAATRLHAAKESTSIPVSQVQFAEHYDRVQSAWRDFDAALAALRGGAQ